MSTISRERRAEDELEALAFEGLNSGEAIEPSPEFWDDLHRQLDERLRKQVQSQERE